jgi:hypothetical protein
MWLCNDNRPFRIKTGGVMHGLSSNDYGFGHQRPTNGICCSSPLGVRAKFVGSRVEIKCLICTTCLPVDCWVSANQCYTNPPQSWSTQKLALAMIYILYISAKLLIWSLTRITHSLLGCILLWVHMQGRSWGYIVYTS